HRCSDGDADPILERLHLRDDPRADPGAQRSGGSVGASGSLGPADLPRTSRQAGKTVGHAPPVTELTAAGEALLEPGRGGIRVILVIEGGAGKIAERECLSVDIAGSAPCLESNLIELDRPTRIGPECRQ